MDCPLTSSRIKPRSAMTASEPPLTLRFACSVTHDGPSHAFGRQKTRHVNVPLRLGRLSDYSQIIHDEASRVCQALR